VIGRLAEAAANVVDNAEPHGTRNKLFHIWDKKQRSQSISKHHFLLFTNDLASDGDSGVGHCYHHRTSVVDGKGAVRDIGCVMGEVVTVDMNCGRSNWKPQRGTRNGMWVSISIGERGYGTGQNSSLLCICLKICASRSARTGMLHKLSRHRQQSRDFDMFRPRPGFLDDGPSQRRS